MLIDYCYHTHTHRCKHARGIDEDYVLEAIKNNLKVIGFSDHVFLKGYSQVGIRGEYSELDEYISSLTALKEKYKDKIQILIGFEAEYIPEMLDYYKSLLKDKIDYLILGQHVYLDEKTNSIKWYFREKDNHELCEKYVHDVIEGMKTGIFKYIAHPDLFATGISKWDDYAVSMAKRIIEASIKYNIPLEYNLGGYRYPYEALFKGMKYMKYPIEQFWDLASTYPIKVIIGPDAHDPEYVHDKKEMEHVQSLYKKYKWNLIHRL